jgi:hypothetical protein
MSILKENSKPCSIFEVAADLFNQPEFLAAVPANSATFIQSLQSILQRLDPVAAEKLEQTLSDSRDCSLLSENDSEATERTNQILSMMDRQKEVLDNISIHLKAFKLRLAPGKHHDSFFTHLESGLAELNGITESLPSNTLPPFPAVSAGDNYMEIKTKNTDS